MFCEILEGQAQLFRLYLIGNKGSINTCGRKIADESALGKLNFYLYKQNEKADSKNALEKTLQKVLVGEIKDDPDKWRDTVCSWIKTINTVVTSYHIDLDFQYNSNQKYHQIF